MLLFEFDFALENFHSASQAAHDDPELSHGPHSNRIVLGDGRFDFSAANLCSSVGAKDFSLAGPGHGGDFHLAYFAARTGLEPPPAQPTPGQSKKNPITRFTAQMF